jgi:hypothetical protein
VNGGEGHGHSIREFEPLSWVEAKGQYGGSQWGLMDWVILEQSCQT